MNGEQVARAAEEMIAKRTTGRTMKNLRLDHVGLIASNVFFGILWIAIATATSIGFSRGWSLSDSLMVASLTALLFFSVGLFRRSWRLTLSIALVSVTIPIYAFEAYLNLYVLPPPTSKIDFVRELRSRGVSAYPSIFPSGFVDLWIRTREGSPIVANGVQLLPLAGILKKLTVYCQHDDGSMVTYRSDRYGFRNPDYDEVLEKAALALLGDSMVQGHCVQDGRDWRARFSSFERTRSYGMNGTSVLIQYAIFKEYIAPRKPKELVWFFVEGNDLSDYLRERELPLLRSYFRSDYSQNLVKLNADISSALEHLIDRNLSQRAIEDISHDSTRYKGIFWNIVFLRKTRLTFGISKTTTPLLFLPDEIWTEVADFWHRVVEQQAENDGTVTFVYIPSWQRYQYYNEREPFESLERRVRKIWSELGAHNVSLSDFLGAPDNALTFYAADRIHFSESGYERSAQYIWSAIDKHAARRCPGRC